MNYQELRSLVGGDAPQSASYTDIISGIQSQYRPQTQYRLQVVRFHVHPLEGDQVSVLVRIVTLLPYFQAFRYAFQVLLPLGLNLCPAFERTLDNPFRRLVNRLRPC